MASERRRKRIAELLKEEISAILLREQEWPEGTIVTVTRVDLSEDVEHANVLVSILPEGAKEEVFASLMRQVGDIQHQLNRRLRMRPVPKIRFLRETATQEADRIEAELYKLQRKG